MANDTVMSHWLMLLVCHSRSKALFSIILSMLYARTHLLLWQLVVPCLILHRVPV